MIVIVAIGLSARVVGGGLCLVECTSGECPADGSVSAAARTRGRRAKGLASGWRERWVFVAIRSGIAAVPGRPIVSRPGSGRCGLVGGPSRPGCG